MSFFSFALSVLSYISLGGGSRCVDACLLSAVDLQQRALPKSHEQPNFPGLPTLTDQTNGQNTFVSEGFMKYC